VGALIRYLNFYWGW